MDEPVILADGRNRSVLTFNNQLPGPLLVVCEGDTVQVTLKNEIIDGPITNSDGSPFSTTLHFHGIREVGRRDQNEQVFGPWSDGVPFVNQCPIDTSQSFTYTFKTTPPDPEKENFNAPPGTYWYHSHIGAQRTNGLEGGLVIKPRRSYTYEGDDVVDIPNKHTVVLQEWYESPTLQAPMSILVNGKGRVAGHVYDSSDYVEVNKYLRGLGASLKKKPHSFNINPNAKYEVFDLDQPVKYYRFRILGLIGQNFPIRVSIDNLKFSAIAADSLDIEPVENLDYLWVSPGERFDIVFPNNFQGTKAVKIRFIGYTNLQDGSSSLCSIAWLRFPGSSVDESYTVPHNCSDFPDYDAVFPRPTEVRVLNPPPQIVNSSLNLSPFYYKVDPYKPDHPGNIYPVDLKSKVDQNIWISPQVNNETREYIEFSSSTTFNGIRTNYSQTPYLLQDPVKHSKRCDIRNKNNPSFLQIPADPNFNHTRDQTICQHVLKFPFKKQSWQEIVLINDDNGVSHPIHQHGGWYWVVGEGQFNHNISRKYIMDLYFKNLLQDNTKNETQTISWRFPDTSTSTDILPKDVIQVPNQGYVILRTHLDNPGTFIFHCHIDFHLSIGMGLGINIKNIL